MKFSLERNIYLPKLIKELANGLRKLTFEDNFQVEVKDVEIAAGQEVAINHSLNEIPKWYIIGRQTGAGQIIDGPTEWDSNFIYLQNTGTQTVTINVIIFR